LNTLPSYISSSLLLRRRWRLDMAELVCLRILLRQELFRLGILYFDDEGQQDANATSCDVPVRQEAPMFVMRPSRRSRRQRSTWRSLPLYLSFSELSDDCDIARLLSPANPHNTPTIQHRNHIPSTQASIIDIDTPLSLPPTTPALSSIELNRSTLLSDVPASPTLVQEGEDWTFVTTEHTRHDSTPSSEPETWILCDDS
jgi:hypothetical protein